jgi:hypothetical protein
MDRVANEYRDSPPGRAALVWLLQYHASGEVAWQIRRTQRIATFGATAHAQQPPAQALAQMLDDEDASAPSAGGRAAIDVASLDRRVGKALAASSAIERTDAVLLNEPAVQFPLAVVQRLRGQLREAARFYGTLARSGAKDDAWVSLAAAEEALAAQGSPLPKSVYHAPRVQTKPLLDGKLDEPQWNQAAAASLASRVRGVNRFPAAAMLSYDEEYLYLAATCRKVDALDYRATNATRQRDADLSRHDRVEFFFDLDRDATSYYRLAIDYRGWTGESCFGSPRYDPTWYVAAASDAETWTVEAAIAWTELAAAPPLEGEAWLLGVQRVAYGEDLQSWTAPAGCEPRPKGFGYLVFD